MNIIFWILVVVIVIAIIVYLAAGKKAKPKIEGSTEEEGGMEIPTEEPPAEESPSDSETPEM